MINTNLAIKTCILLAISCSIMTVAWYYHLKFEKWTMATAILLSWGIAFFEYMFMVPANRIGIQAGFTPAALRGIAELFILTAFIIFQTFVLDADLIWNYVVGFAVVFIGVLIVLFGPFTKILYTTKKTSKYVTTTLFK